MKLSAKILQGGKTATGIIVPDDVVAALGSGRRPAIKATINGYTYRTSIGTMRGKFMLGISAEVREKAGVSAGDEIEVDLELDTEVRVMAVPPDMMDALNANPQAKAFYESLRYSRQRWFIDPLALAKTAETRERRIAKAISMLERGEVGN